MESVHVQTISRPSEPGWKYRYITDQLLGVVAHDDCVGPYVDLFVEGASVPFDTVNVWRYEEKRREDDDRVLDLVLDWFRSNREEDEEE